MRGLRRSDTPIRGIASKPLRTGCNPLAIYVTSSTRSSSVCSCSELLTPDGVHTTRRYMLSPSSLTCLHGTRSSRWIPGSRRLVETHFPPQQQSGDAYNDQVAPSGADRVPKLLNDPRINTLARDQLKPVGLWKSKAGVLTLRR